MADSAVLETPPVPVTLVPVTPAAPVQSWRDSLAPEYRDLPDVKDLPDVNAAVKRMVEARRMVGAEKIVMPGKDATPEQLNEYWTKLGRPESPDKYELPTDNMPAGITLDPALTKAAFEEFHKLGISKTQAAELVRWQAKAASDRMEATKVAQDQQIESNLTLLRKEFGKAFDEKDQQAVNAIQTFGGKEALDLIIANPTLGTNPVFVRMMAKIGREIAQDPIRGGGHQQTFTLSPSEAQAQILAKYADEKFMKAYTTKTDPGHAQAVAEINALHQAAKPEQEKQPGT